MFLVKSKPLGSLAEVQDALQYAIELEHATIPPYLTAQYSLKEGTNLAIAAIISSIVFQEMKHMAIAANILNAINGRPMIDNPAFVPKYPGGLPFHIGDRNGNRFEVPLKHFSLELVRDVFMHIEEPDQPLVLPEKSLTFEFNTSYEFRTIGAFYGALRDALKPEWFTGDPDRQVGGVGEVVTKIATLADARAGIDRIIREGEGTTVSPSDGREIAHYYRFEQIARQLTLLPDMSVPAGYSFGQPSIPFDPTGVWPTIDNPNSTLYPPGSPAAIESDIFNRSYSKLLEALHGTFNSAPERLNDAIELMSDIKFQAISLMQISVGDGKTAAPCFEYVAK